MKAQKGASELVRRIEGYNEGFEILSIVKNAETGNYTVEVKEVPIEEDK